MRLSYKLLLTLVLTIAQVTTPIPHREGQGGGSAFAQDYRTGIRIGWDYRTQTFVTGGAYGRLKLLSDGRQAFVYDAGGVCKIRFRESGVSSFQAAITVATPASGSSYTNCELLELADGTLLYAYNERVNGMGMKIKVIYSFNSGRSWRNAQTLYEVQESGFLPQNEGLYGIWEPAMIQLPSGEVQLFFASEYKVPGNDQKIVMLRSLTADETGIRKWEPEAVDVCYTVGFRDGMPVPLVLQDDKGIVFAIEDDGYGGGFQPGILYSSIADNWSSGIRYGDSTNRWVAVVQGEPRGGGAPYIIQLKTGETLVSTQTNALADTRGAPWDDMYKNRPFVYIGDANARNFSRYSIPFPFMDEPNQGGVWNSLCQTNDSTVVCVSEVHGHPSKNGLWTVDGHIMHPLTAHQMSDGTHLETITWQPLMSDIIIGSQTQACMHVGACWTTDSLFLHFVVDDQDIRSGSADAPVWDTDGVEFYCDVQNRSTDNVPTGALKYLVNVDGGTLVSRMTASGWTDVNAETHQMRYTTTRTEDGYIIDIALPWSTFMRMPRSKKFVAYFKLHNNDLHQGKECIHHEVLSGTDEGRTRTWWQFTLDDQLPTAITAISAPSVTVPYDSPSGSVPASSYFPSGLFYSLSGLPTPSPRRGIFIHAGKKTVLR